VSWPVAPDGSGAWLASSAAVSVSPVAPDGSAARLASSVAVSVFWPEAPDGSAARLASSVLRLELVLLGVSAGAGDVVEFVTGLSITLMIGEYVF